MHSAAKQRAWRIMRAAASVVLIGLAGCDVGTEFRAAATPAVHAGVSSIINGLVDGVFAAIAVEPENL